MSDVDAAPSNSTSVARQSGSPPRIGTRTRRKSSRFLSETRSHQPAPRLCYVQTHQWEGVPSFSESGFYFRGSNRTSTSVSTLTGWPPFTVGL
jgi:hypothetical protein